MKLFNLILGNEIPETSGLCFKGGAYRGGIIEVPCGGTADFGAYFNYLRYNTYRTYCGVESVTLNLYASGKYTVKFCLYTKNRCVSVLKSLQADGDFAGSVDISCLPEGGLVYFTVYSEEGCEIYGGDWSTTEEARRDVKIGIAICTYKREKFVTENLKRIAYALEREDKWAGRVHAFVVDNAGTLNMEKSPYYDVITNKNTGGSGGFTRGICEIYGSGVYTHMLLMDDDIEFNFEMIKRTWVIASLLTEEHAETAIGGTMLILENPCVQQELGGLFNGLKISPVNGKLDVSDINNLLVNENAEKADYQGWWFCCMPVTCVEKYGLPMPFFIKIDDIEYSLRCCREIIVNSGIAVWHGGFESKSSYTLEYYIKRNESVVCAIMYSRTRFTVAFKLLYSTHAQLLQKDYGYVETILHGYRDFIKGSAFFMQTDPEKLNAEVMSCRPQSLTYGEIEDICGVNPQNAETGKPHKTSIFKKAIFFIENYMPAFTLKNKAGVIDMNTPYPSRAYLKKTVIKCNAETKTGYVCVFDKKRRAKLRKQIAAMFFTIIFRYGKIKKDYKANAKKMCSREQWDRIFNG